MDALRAWFTAHGGSFHPAAVLDTQGPYGVSVLAPRFHEDTTIVTCPFDLIITKHSALKALRTLLGPHVLLDTWSERQLICSYLCFHQLCSEPSSSEVLCHRPYVQSLPAVADLLTPLHFTPTEREALRGTNLYGATLDRECDWQAEWAQCQSLVRGVDPAWGEAFTWDVYLTASTHLSSRAFPSSILSSNPSLVASPSTHPVLIPGVDLLNHRRGEPVSWVVSCQDGAQEAASPNTVSLVSHPTPDSESTSCDGRLYQVFNNYGPKPNDELILGYGFSLAGNPDDRITLQVGGGSAKAQKWSIGRDAHNMQGLWAELWSMLASADSEYAFEDDLETAAVLSDMVRAKLAGMKTVADVRESADVRPAVRAMLEHYIEGQRAILESILRFSDEKEQAAIDAAREQGIDLVLDDRDDD